MSDSEKLLPKHGGYRNLKSADEAAYWIAEVKQRIGHCISNTNFYNNY
ncbi:hypothetical protein [Sedimentisphaera salicampi]|nr:hypothetical protein [Sedimentisphaera salicampi]